MYLCDVGCFMLDGYANVYVYVYFVGVIVVDLGFSNRMIAIVMRMQLLLL